MMLEVRLDDHVLDFQTYPVFPFRRITSVVVREEPPSFEGIRLSHPRSSDRYSSRWRGLCLSDPRTTIPRPSPSSRSSPSPHSSTSPTMSRRKTPTTPPPRSRQTR